MMTPRRSNRLPPNGQQAQFFRRHTRRGHLWQVDAAFILGIGRRTMELWVAEKRIPVARRRFTGKCSRGKMVWKWNEVAITCVEQLLNSRIQREWTSDCQRYGFPGPTLCL